MHTQHSLTDHLVRSGVLTTPHIIQAFRTVDRKHFLPDTHNAESVYANQALSIDYGQTISQPSVVAFMCELLQPESGEKILDVGSGSGWTTAILAQIVGEKGFVHGVELVPELVSYGSENLAKYYFAHASIVQATGTYGLPAYAPYDKILVSASSMHIPQELIDQLAIDGVLVMPVHREIVRYQKRGYGNGMIDRYGGFDFVPLIDPKNY